MVKKRTERMDSSDLHPMPEEKVLLKVKTITTNFGDERRRDAVVASFKDHHKRRKVITDPSHITHRGRQALMIVTKLGETGGFTLIATPSALIDGVRGFVVDSKLIAGTPEKWAPQTEEEEAIEINHPIKIKKSKAVLGNREIIQSYADKLLPISDIPMKKGRGRPVGSKDLKPRKKRSTK